MRDYRGLMRDYKETNEGLLGSIKRLSGVYCGTIRGIMKDFPGSYEGLSGSNEGL